LIKEKDHCNFKNTKFWLYLY